MFIWQVFLDAFAFSEKNLISEAIVHFGLKACDVKISYVATFESYRLVFHSVSCHRAFLVRRLRIELSDWFIYLPSQS